MGVTSNSVPVTFRTTTTDQKLPHQERGGQNDPSRPGDCRTYSAGGLARIQREHIVLLRTPSEHSQQSGIREIPLLEHWTIHGS